MVDDYIVSTTITRIIRKGKEGEKDDDNIDEKRKEKYY
jgi:hypothetical protein